MNELVKVYSYRRSGTNLLCGLLYINYYPGEEMWSGEDRHPNKIFIDDEGLTGKRNKWGSLFGSHRSVLPGNIDNAIYIYRDVDSTCESYYRYLKGLGNIQTLKFTDWRDGLFIREEIKRHHNTFLKSGIYAVKMEDLINKPIYELGKIEDHFGLYRKDPLKLLERRVGWFPK